MRMSIVGLFPHADQPVTALVTALRAAEGHERAALGRLMTARPRVAALARRVDVAQENYT